MTSIVRHRAASVQPPRRRSSQGLREQPPRGLACRPNRPRYLGFPLSSPKTPAHPPMATFRCELDAPNNIVMVMVTEDDGSEHDYQFDFDPRSGRYEFSEREILERDFGTEWVEEMENAVKGLIEQAVRARRG